LGYAVVETADERSSMNTTDVGTTIGLVSLTTLDLAVINAALEVAYGMEDVEAETGFPADAVTACGVRIEQGIEEAKTW
jgi:hypothetical protein